MSILDLLLETNIEKLQEKNCKEFEVKRLSEILGTKFVINCKALTNEQIAHIGEICKNNAEVKMQTVLEGCRLEDKKLNHKELIKKFNVNTPMEVLSKLFLPGEIYELYTAVNALSGYSSDAVEEIKNS